MGLLAPLYLIGLTAIGLPIILHLIRRTPQGRQMFSTLMFLSSSPPRLTRRSRLTNILLLILRAAAIMILAFAFMRPFVNWGATIEPQAATGKRVAILVDISASMRRGDLWQQAQARVQSALAELSSLDDAGLYFFDTQVHPGFTFAQWNDAEPGNRMTLLKSSMAQAAPGWGATRLGDALAAAADMVSQSDGKVRDTRKIQREVVLISDLQQGGHVEALQGHEWPQDVWVDVPAALKVAPGNASVQWITQAASDRSEGTLRVKVNNEADSKGEQFTLTWANDKGPVAGVAAEKLYVAPGESKIVKLTWPSEAKADRLVLGGDAWDFDNTLYLAQPRMDTLRVLYIGPEAANDFNGMRYYLQSALADTPRRHVEFVTKKPSEEITDADLAGVRLVVAGGIAERAAQSDAGEIAEAAAGRLRKFVEDGGDVLWVMRDLGSAKPLEGLLGETIHLDEVSGDYALISRIDVTHPLFAPFADARFGDFTQIHFWRHRKAQLRDAAGVLAWFDNGDPYLFERLLGQKGGRVRVMTSGWNPVDSQLAVSTKFVPLVERVVRRKDEVLVEAQYFVNDGIALPEAGPEGVQREMILPDGKRTPLGTGFMFAGTDRPGIYRLSAQGSETPIAINIEPEESRTVALPPEELERWGVRLKRPVNMAEAAEQEKRLLSTELENRQKLWRWLIVIALGLLGVETVLAGRMARRSLQEQAVL